MIFGPNHSICCRRRIRKTLKWKEHQNNHIVTWRTLRGDNLTETQREDQSVIAINPLFSGWKSRVFPGTACHWHRKIKCHGRWIQNTQISSASIKLPIQPKKYQFAVTSIWEGTSKHDEAWPCAWPCAVTSHHWHHATFAKDTYPPPSTADLPKAQRHGATTPKTDQESPHLVFSSQKTWC